LRFSLGHDSTRDDVAAALAALVPSVERARRAGAASMAS
jgi:cysteine desulfurase